MAPQPAPTAKGIKSRSFLLLFQGNLVSQMGSQAFSIAMLFLIKHQTGSATLMGLLLMAAMLPGVLAGPFGGSFADLYPRKRIIVVSDLINGLCVTAFAVYYFAFPEVNTQFLVLLFIVSVVVSTVRAFFTPAVLAALPDMVPAGQLTTANSMVQGGTQLSMLIGQGIGGLLYRLVGPAWLFMIDGLSYLLSMVSELFIKLPHRPQAQTQTQAGQTQTDQDQAQARPASPAQRFRHETVQGLRYIWQHKSKRVVFMAAGAVNFFFAPIMVLMPFYVEDYLQLPTDWYGYVYAFFGLGTLIGFGLASGLPLKGKATSLLVGLCFTLFGAITMGLAWWVNLPAVIALCIVGGISIGVVNINIITQLQAQSKEQYRGRVMGNLTTLSTGIMPISLALTGIVLDLLHQDVLLLLQITGGVVVAISLLLLLNRHFMAFFAFVAPPQKPEATATAAVMPEKQNEKATTTQHIIEEAVH